MGRGEVGQLLWWEAQTCHWIKMICQALRAHQMKLKSHHRHVRETWVIRCEIYFSFGVPGYTRMPTFPCAYSARNVQQQKWWTWHDSRGDLVMMQWDGCYQTQYCPIYFMYQGAGEREVLCRSALCRLLCFQLPQVHFHSEMPHNIIFI